ncbi:hypothetical protein GPALN_006234 [Globodera pallida]|nr:hypothetical protein GPALN_006234 [Globodera pallida]
MTTNILEQSTPKSSMPAPVDTRQDVGIAESVSRQSVGSRRTDCHGHSQLCYIRPCLDRRRVANRQKGAAGTYLFPPNTTAQMHKKKKRTRNGTTRHDTMLEVA